MKLIVGLGNPGRKYVSTRHNLGYVVVEQLSKKWNIKLRKNSKFDSKIGDLANKSRVLPILMKPLTFVNLSGHAVIKVLSKFSILPEEILVIVDDLSLPLGKIRLRLKGSSGGHKGLESIITELNTEKFPRLKLGIGPAPVGKTYKDFVLSKFNKSEKPIVKKMLNVSVKAVENILAKGFDRAINVVNTSHPDYSCEGEKCKK